MGDEGHDQPRSIAGVATWTITAVLPEADWTARAKRHADRAATWTEPHLARRLQGRSHPVLDFLFTYYGTTPARLRRWYPGHGVVLSGDAALPRRAWRHHVLVGGGDREAPDGVVLDTGAYLAQRGTAVAFVRDLLAATASRQAHLGCFGLHEWAMVYRQPAEQVRHGGWPLRLGSAGTDAVVESHPVRCSHFDAFRFFTPEAAPRNSRQLRREDQVSAEQPGCLHAAMDLYKWASKLGAAVPGELLLDCFALAYRAREVDMRAAPYDLHGLGYEPIRIETPEGRAVYTASQRTLADDAAPLRARLLDVCGQLLG